MKGYNILFRVVAVRRIYARGGQPQRYDFIFIWRVGQVRLSVLLSRIFGTK